MNSDNELNLSECETVLLRQFDADCRPGLPVPADVAAHLASCANCQHEWAQQQHVDVNLRRALTVEVPVSLARRAYHAAVEIDQPQATPAKRWLHGLYAGLAGAGAAQLLSLLPLTANWQWLIPATFLLVSCGAFLFDLYQDNTTPSL